MPEEVARKVEKRGPGRPRVNFDARRNEIIGVATRLFAQQGFHATSVEDICRAAGIGRGVLYHYVSSKGELLLAIHERFIEPLLARAQEIAAAGDPPDVTLRKLSRELMRTIVTYRDEVTVFLHEWKALVASEEEWRGVREQRRAFEAIIRETIQRGQRQGLFKEIDPQMTAMAFLGMHNYAYQWLNPEGRLPWEEVAALFTEILIHGIVQPEHG